MTDTLAQDIVEGRIKAPVAQRIEHPVPNREGGSSSLSGRAKAGYQCIKLDGFWTVINIDDWPDGPDAPDAHTFEG